VRQGRTHGWIDASSTPSVKSKNEVAQGHVEATPSESTIINVVVVVLVMVVVLVTVVCVLVSVVCVCVVLDVLVAVVVDLVKVVDDVVKVVVLDTVVVVVVVHFGHKSAVAAHMKPGLRLKASKSQHCVPLNAQGFGMHGWHR